MNKPLCIIAGVGSGNGLSFCNKFHKEVYRVVILSGSLERLKEYAGEREDIFTYSCDLSNPDSVKKYLPKSFPT